MRRCGDRVAGKPLEGLGHVFDRGVLILIGHCSRVMSADFLTYPLLDPHTSRTCTERVTPRVIWLNTWVGDAGPPHPFGQPLSPGSGMLARRLGLRTVEQRLSIPGEL
jgi:hypothetical protein